MSTLRDQLQAIYEAKGVLTPESVVEEARPEDHPLHPRFEWDDAIASERWRRHQAHELIQAVTIVYKDRKGTCHGVRAFQAIREESGGYAYRPSEEVAADPMLTELVRREMQRDWRNLKARYDHFSEFAEMIMADLTEAVA